MTYKAPRIEAVRPAGPNHQVITLTSKVGESKFIVRPEPCETCPWRVDATGEFPAQAFLHSVSTSYDMAEKTFACHSSGKTKPAICAGFALKAQNNMTLRFKIINGEFNPDKISDGGHELHDDYRSMAIANGVDPKHPALKPCR